MFKRNLQKKLEKISGSKNLELRAGFLGGKYEDGESVPKVAIDNEFGDPSKRRPPRPFFRIAIAKNKQDWLKMPGALIKRGATAQEALNITGHKMADDIQASIRELRTPKLAQATIDAKGFDKPLIDTGQMLNSVSWEVE